MTVLSIVHPALCLALVISGVDKLRHPDPAARAMAAARLPLLGSGRRASGRVLGIGEIVVGTTALAVVHPAPTLVVAGAYAALAGFVILLRTRDASAACGCFGTGEAAPGWAHVIVDLCAAGLALDAALVGPPDLAERLDDALVVVAASLGASTVVALAVLILPARFPARRH